MRSILFRKHWIDSTLPIDQAVDSLYPSASCTYGTWALSLTAAEHSASTAIDPGTGMAIAVAGSASSA